MDNASSQDPLLPTHTPSDAIFYQDGDEVIQVWDVPFVVLAYVISYIGAYAAIRLLEHMLWRSKREAANSSCKYHTHHAWLVHGRLDEVILLQVSLNHSYISFQCTALPSPS